MKKHSNLISRCALVAAVAGAFCLAQTVSATEEPAKASSSAAPQAKDAKMDKAEGSAGKSLDSKDRDFMMKAAKGGMMEVHMGQMAEKQGQSADVKKIGARMVADHTKVNNELMALAQTKGVKLDTRHKMDKMDAANFDQMYLDQMVKDHEKDIAEFETEAKSGMDPELKSFASKNLPTLKKHLEMVKAAQGKMKKG